MATHNDAIGYLNDLSVEVNQSWFTMISELAISKTALPLNQTLLDTLVALFEKKASYIARPVAASVVTSSVVTPTNFLEYLSGFVNFKRLENELKVSFPERVNLIFGTNGSGKSSLCESLKVLATHEVSLRPLENVRVANPAATAFKYKFKNDAADQVWKLGVGRGSRQNDIKYFDTSIAIKNVKNSVEPGRVIEIEPFKLNIFESVKAMTSNLREALMQKQKKNSTELELALKKICNDFSEFKDSPLSSINDGTVAILPVQIGLGMGYIDGEMLVQICSEATELEKATSVEGVKLLKAECSELETFLEAIENLIKSALALWELQPAKKTNELFKRQAALTGLAESLVPKGERLETFLPLLEAASKFCKISEADGEACPLCRRDLGAPEIALFKQYHDLLINEIKKEIDVLKSALDRATEFENAVKSIDRNHWDKYVTVPAEVLENVKVKFDCIVANCNAIKEHSVEAKEALGALKQICELWNINLESKKSALNLKSTGEVELRNQLTRLNKEIESLRYAQAINVRLVELQRVQWRVERSKYWRDELPAFTQVLTKITKKAKDAHEELVVGDFELRLNKEYLALTERRMTEFGVTLVRKGADATVSVMPQIGGKNLDGVLSEGELRVHALALFFAELETSTQSVLVFDDPISSFDYNYIANYCIRLRDFAQKHSNRQIIVLTHNWEFFVQLQTTLNQALLNSHLSIQVLEDCLIAASYSEKIDDLKRDIEAMLNLPNEPSKSVKIDVAGKMRRLIEVVVNTQVFNSQRHQFKQKSLQITAFQAYTKLVALLPQEATKLRDLYAKLSISEHDDPRNTYINTDKAMFKMRYDEIVGIESNIKARKP